MRARRRTRGQQSLDLRETHVNLQESQLGPLSLGMAEDDNDPFNTFGPESSLAPLPAAGGPSARQVDTARGKLVSFFPIGSVALTYHVSDVSAASELLEGLDDCRAQNAEEERRRGTQKRTDP